MVTLDEVNQLEGFGNSVSTIVEEMRQASIGKEKTKYLLYHSALDALKIPPGIL